MQRSTVFDLIAPDDKRQAIINSIRLYRAACRKAFSACAMAEMAGAEISVSEEKGVVVKPTKDSQKAILEKAFGIEGKKAHLYELRLWLRELCPTWLSIVPEAIHIAVSGRWRSPDPEFPKAKRGWLTLQGARDMSRFNHIGITLKNTVPKLSVRGFSAKWDYDIGDIEFSFGRMDGGRYFVWKNLASKTPGWKLGTIYLGERDGKLKATVTHSRPDKKSEPDKTRTLELAFNDDMENFITMKGPDEFCNDRINAAEMISYLNQLNTIRKKYQTELAGNRRGKARRSVVRKLNNLTDRREGYCKDRNHLYSRLIVNAAERFGCGIVAAKLPEKTLPNGEPWGWNQFELMLKYKAEEKGIELKC